MESRQNSFEVRRLVHTKRLVLFSKRLNTLLTNLLHGFLASDDALDLLKDSVPSLELEEWHILVDTISDEIMSSLCEEKISLLSSRQIGDSVTGVEHGWALIRWEVCVGTDGDGFVVSEITVKSCC